MSGMTLKQYNLYRFVQVLKAYREAKQRATSVEGRQLFVELSVQMHIAKTSVPKRYWPLINKVNY